MPASVSTRGRVPPRTAEVRGPVSRPVLVHWDTWGVPHVRASSLRDGYVALGYAMAQERLWQLDYMRRQARGELAAVLGERAVASDRAMRTLSLRRTAELDARELPAEVAEVLDALATGINLWTERVTRPPIEFELLGYRPTPWRIEDSIAVWKYRWWYNSGRLEQIVLAELARRLLPPELESAFMAAELADETLVPSEGAGAQLRAGARGADTGEGSNNWAVAASGTTTGGAVLCSDPHNPFAAPSQWFEAQLTVDGPGGFDVVGAFYCGAPGVYIGRNRRVAWGVTNHVIPVRDLYVEADGPFEVEREAIEVAGGEPVEVTIRRTPRGPVVTDGSGLVPEGLLDGEPVLSLRWVGHDRGTGIDASLALHRARSVDEATGALRKWPCPPLNFVYADADGRVAFHVASRVPRRAAITRGLRRADDPRDAWDGDVPFDDLPQLIDPPRGWVATANNPPWRADDASAFRRGYVALAHWSDGHRMRRIRERLTAKPKLSPDEIASIQAEVDSPRARDLVPSLLAVLAGSKDRRVKAAARYLGRWDRQFTADAVGASIWAAFWDAWRIEVAAARFPTRAVKQAANQAGALASRLLVAAAQPSPLPPGDPRTLLGEDAPHPARETEGEEPRWFPDGDVAGHVLRAFGAGLDRLASASGTTRPSGWRWGKLHTVTFHHPLGGAFDTGPSPTSGGHTVRATGFEIAGDFRVISGSTYRFVAELDGSRTRSVQNLGQSAHRSSRHYRDQNRLWLEDRYKPLWMDEADVQANLEGTTTLHPSG